jgi:ribosomal protein L11 methyltransferase
MTARHATALETVSVTVPADALEPYEAALSQVCGTVGFFLDDNSGLWTVEGVKDQGASEPEFAAALALAAAVTGVVAQPQRCATPAEGWLQRTHEAFPEQFVGRRLAIRGTHVTGAQRPGRLTIVLDAAIAFGSGEHGSTRGCLRALERVAHRRLARILDLGTGSGILAMAAAKLLHQYVLGSDIDPWAVRMAHDNAARNGLSRRCRFVRANGWTSPAIRRAAPYDLVFANILARPLCRMAASLARRLAPGGTAILAGLLDTQARWVLAAHRHQGLVLERALREDRWMTLVLQKPRTLLPPPLAGLGCEADQGWGSAAGALNSVRPAPSPVPSRKGRGEQ